MFGQMKMPVDLTNAVAMAAGDGHVLALRADGTVTAWGQNDYGQARVPDDVTNVVGIAAGSTHSLALRGDGTVRFWGNIYSRGVSNAPPEAQVNTAGLALGSTAQHVLQLRPDGKVLEWGNSNSSYRLLNVPPAATNVISAAVGSFYSVALRANGTLVGWGAARTGGSFPSAPSTVGFTAVAVGGDHALALRTNGTLATWGKNQGYGELTVPTSVTNVVAIACGLDHNLVLRGDGRVLAWGRNDYGQTNVPAGLTNVVALACETWGSFVLIADDGPPLLGRPLVPPTAVGMAALLRVTAISTTPLSYQWIFCGTNLPGATNATLTLTNVQLAQAGEYSIIVSNQFGAVTNAGMNLAVAPVVIAYQPRTQISLVGDNPSFVVLANTATSATYQWRFNDTEMAGKTNASLTLTNVQLADAGSYSVTVSNALGGELSSDATLTVVPSRITSPPQNRSTFPGGTATFSITAQANIPLSYQWRFNGGDLAGATASSLTLTNVQFGQEGVYSVILSNAFETVTNSATLVVSPLAGWGRNGSGQLTMPAGLTNLVSIAGGGDGGLALSSDGTVAAWGSDVFGQTNLPPDLTNTVAIAAGGYHNLALRKDGTLTAWGSDSGGQSSVPVGLAEMVMAAGGFKHTLVLKNDGTLAAWGDNTYGQANCPAGLTNVIAIAAGGNHNLALSADGSVVAWGLNSSGQTNTPSDLTNVVAVSAGFHHSLALRADGTVVGWGYNSSGQTSIPAGLTSVVAIAGGYDHSLALKADGSVVVWGSNSAGQRNVPVGLETVSAIAAGHYHNFALTTAGPLLRDAVPVSLGWSNGIFTVSMPSQRGRVYQLEYKESLDDAQWSGLPLAAGTGAILALPDSSIANSHRFYRVREW